MGQIRKLAVSALNVRIVDNSLRDYPALFKAILRLKRSVEVRRPEHVMLTAFGKEQEGFRVPYSGVIGKYTDIPDDAAWLDTENLEAADDDRLEEITIPASLKPNYVAFYCALFPKEHIFIFESFSESKSLSPGHVEKWLRKIVSDNRIRKRFGEIEVDLIPDYDVVDKIIESKSIREISITIKNLNPEDLGQDAFNRMEAKLHEMNATRQKITYTAPRGEFLNLPDEEKALARVGAENGSVDARIFEDGTVQPFSTSRHPIEVQDTYDAEDLSTATFFRSMAVKLQALVQRNRKAAQ